MHRSVPVEQQSARSSALVQQSVPEERQSVPISVPAERQSVPEEFVAHTAHAQSVREEQQSLAVSAHHLEPSAAIDTFFCEHRKADQHHV
jgi:hypothetical protein